MLGAMLIGIGGNVRENFADCGLCVLAQLVAV